MYRNYYLILPVLVFAASVVIFGSILFGGELHSPRANYMPDLKAKLSQKLAKDFSLAVNDLPLPSLAAIPHYLVFNLDNGTVYAAKAVAGKLSPASFTKLLSAQVALDIGHKDQLLTATKTSVDKVPTILGLRVGEQLTLTDLLRASIATSGNDAATTLAEGVANQNGLVLSGFIDLMNEKARLLGMTNSHFTNADGLDDVNQYSTLSDLANLVVNTYRNYPEIASASASDRADIPVTSTHDQYYLPNWNGLLGVYPGVFGGKIAYTQTAGYATIVLSERKGVRLVALLTGADSIPERDLAAAALLDAGFIFEKIAPARLKKNHLSPRYQQWSDLARQIRANVPN